MDHPSRRAFIRTAGAGLAAASVLSAMETETNPVDPKPGSGPSLTFGLASYTFRRFTLDQTIEFAARLRLMKITLKDFHLPMDASDGDLAAAARKVRNAGLDLYGCGVVYMKSAADVDRAFHYAAAAGIATIIGAPEIDLLPVLDAKTRESGIRVAIHNHGPEDAKFPSAASVLDRIRGLNPLVGLCLDVGHSRRAGENPAEMILKARRRLLDVHLKDIDSAEKTGTTVEMGRGVLDIPSILRALLKIGYREVASFEFEKDEADPLPGLAESVGYARGVLAGLK
jgi:inosose dehydratase